MGTYSCSDTLRQQRRRLELCLVPVNFISIALIGRDFLARILRNLPAERHFAC